MPQSVGTTMQCGEETLRNVRCIQLQRDRYSSRQFQNEKGHFLN